MIASCLIALGTNEHRGKINLVYNITPSQSLIIKIDRPNAIVSTV